MQENGEPYYQSMALGVAARLLARREPEIAVRIIAVIDSLRDDGRFVGAARDLEAQSMLRDRLVERLDAETFAAAWSEGRTLSLDDATAVALDELAGIAESR